MKYVCAVDRKGRGILVLRMEAAQHGTLDASQQQRFVRDRALAAGVAARIPEDIFNMSMLGAEAVLVLSQACQFLKLLWKGGERRRVRGALQLVRIDWRQQFLCRQQVAFDASKSSIAMRPQMTLRKAQSLWTGLP